MTPPLLLLSFFCCRSAPLPFSPLPLTPCLPHFPSALWDYPTLRNTLSLRGHKNAVLRVAWLPASTQQLATASADRTCILWDAPTGSRVRVFSGHERIVNDVAASHTPSCLLASASDDGACILWDARSRHSVAHIPGNFPLLACALDSSSASQTLFTAGVEGVIRAYDLRGMGSSSSSSGSGSGSEGLLPTLTLEDAGGGISSLAPSPSSSELLALGFDGLARSYDVQAFCAAPVRLKRGYDGGAPRASASYDAGLLRASWSPGGDRVAMGGADKLVRVFDAQTSALLAALPGHTGACVETAWHPKEAVIGSAGDRTCFLSELAF